VHTSPVIVVGGGASGLSAAGALARLGIDSVVLDQDTRIGGTWARRYDRLHLHTVRSFSGLAHFSIPTHYPTYLSRDNVIEYLEAYARHFGLRMVGGTAVKRIHAHGGGWAVETEAGHAWHAPVVVIATGQYRDPIMPSWPGRDLFAGRLLHSTGYANPGPFAGQRVLVVGAGNSGAEIAVDLCDHGASFVALSVRTPPPIVRRDPFGLPIQRASLVLSLLPPAIANRLARLTARLTVGDLTRHGMPSAAFAPYTTKRVPLIDVGLVDALEHRRVAVRTALSHLTRTDAVFVDGMSEPFDAIIAATGFTTGLESFVDVPGVLDDAGEPRAASGEPTAHPGLYFIGFVHSLRGHLFEANRASRRLARHIQRNLAGRY